MVGSCGTAVGGMGNVKQVKGNEGENFLNCIYTKVVLSL